VRRVSEHYVSGVGCFITEHGKCLTKLLELQWTKIAEENVNDVVKATSTPSLLLTITFNNNYNDDNSY